MQTHTMLKKTDEFSSVFSFRKRFSQPHIVVHYQPNQIAQLKIGFVVAKKVAKRAVDRNYMRRVLRAFCQNQLAHHFNGELDGFNAVIQVRKKFGRKEFSTVNQELESLFVKIQRKKQPHIKA